MLIHNPCFNETVNSQVILNYDFKYMETQLQRSPSAVNINKNISEKTTLSGFSPPPFLFFTLDNI